MKILRAKSSLKTNEAFIETFISEDMTPLVTPLCKTRVRQQICTMSYH